MRVENFTATHTTLVLLVVAVVLQVIAVACPYWIEIKRYMAYGTMSVGLWQACVIYICINYNRFNGIVSLLGNMRLTQIAVCIALLLQLIAAVIGLLAVLKPQRKTTFLVVVAVISFLAWLANFVAVLVFALMVFWFLSWAYVLSCISAVLSLVAFIIAIVARRKILKNASAENANTATTASAPSDMLNTANIPPGTVMVGIPKKEPLGDTQNSDNPVVSTENGIPQGNPPPYEETQNM